MKKILNIVILILLSQVSSVCQVINNDQCTGANVGTGALFILKTVGCVPLTVEVAKTDTVSKDHKYIFDYKGGVPANLVVEKKHTYTVPGAYKLMQVSFRKDNGQELRICAVITVLDTVKLDIKPKICGNKVSLTITDVRKSGTLPYDYYYLDWGDSSPIEKINLPSGVISHTYANQTDRKIIVRGGYIVDDCGASSLVLVKFPKIDQPQIIEFERVGKDKINLSFNNVTGDDFKILANNASLELNKGTLGLQKIVFNSNLRGTCYAIQMESACYTNNTSKEICDIDFEANSIDTGNELKWLKPRPEVIKDFTVLKNTISKISVNGTNYIDSSIICNQENCYQIKFSSNQTSFLSEKVCLKNNLIKCDTGLAIYIPLAFSPNGDGINDVLEIKGELDKFISLTIVDRLGHLVKIISNPTDKWDGGEMPAGLYTFMLKTKISANGNADIYGRVYLLR